METTTLKIDTLNHFDLSNICKFEHDYAYFMGPAAYKREYERVINLVENIDSQENRKEIATLIKKIENFIKRTGSNSSVDFWIEKIKNKDEAALSLFSVEPKRQGSSKKFGSQQFQIDTINQLIESQGCEMKSLVNSGKESYRIYNGSILKGIEKDFETSSSLDSFTQTNTNLRIFNIMKVTHNIIGENDKGGMQNHQLENATKMIDTINFELVENENIYIILVLDGKFYTNNKILQENIKKYKNNKNVYFTTSYKYQDVLRSILHN
jgi:hypothetical protein